MKKLLLTLFAVAAIVACQKEDDSIAIQPDASMDAQLVSGESSRTVDLLENLEGILASAEGMSKQFNLNELVPSSERNIGADTLEISLHAYSGSDYLVIQGGDTDDICRDNAGVEDLGKIGFVKTDANNFNVVVYLPTGSVIEASTGNSLSSGLNGLFTVASAAGFTSISRVNLRLFPLEANISVPNAGIACVGSLYTVTAAPFPLNGWLATLNANADLSQFFGGSSLNYAGTDEAAVRAAIEADIMNGN